MVKREALHRNLVSILGSNNVYFQPPETLKIKYPCIVYSLSSDITKHADDKKYLNKNRYTITIIDKNPDSEFPNLLKELDYCSFDRFFVSDNLNHFVFDLYY